MALTKKEKKAVAFEIEDVEVAQVAVRLQPQPVVDVHIRTKRTGDLVGPQGQAIPAEGMRVEHLKDTKLAADIIGLVEAVLNAA